MRSIPFYLSLALIFTIPWENAVTVGALGTLARVTGMVTVTIWLGSALLERRFRRPHLFHAAVCIFGLWNILSLYWTADQVWTSQRIATVTPGQSWTRWAPGTGPFHRCRPAGVSAVF